MLFSSHIVTTVIFLLLTGITEGANLERSNDDRNASASTSGPNLNTVSHIIVNNQINDQDVVCESASQTSGTISSFAQACATEGMHYSIIVT